MPDPAPAPTPAALVAAALARAEAATPGPWSYTHVSELPRVRQNGGGTCAGLLMADCENSHLDDKGVANAEFIAWARDGVPALAAALTAALAERDAARALLQDLLHDPEVWTTDHYGGVICCNGCGETADFPSEIAHYAECLIGRIAAFRARAAGAEAG